MTIFALRLLIASAALTFGAEAAQAQTNGNVPSDAAVSGLGVKGPDSVIRIDGDTTARDEAVARENAIATAGKPETAKAHALPARPEEIAVGAELRDVRGAMIGRIDSVTAASAVVNYTTGKVAIPLDALGRNDKGLLIGMTRADFLKLAATAQ